MKLTVIIPAYNAEEHIIRYLDMDKILKKNKQ